MQISRVSGTAVFPARFMLVLRHESLQVRLVRLFGPLPLLAPGGRQEGDLSRLSGPRLLDRIDLFVEVPPLDFDALSRRTPAEPSAAIKRPGWTGPGRCRPPASAPAARPATTRWARRSSPASAPWTTPAAP